MWVWFYLESDHVGWFGAGNTVEEVVEILETLTQLRKDAGRENEPFESIAPLTVPPDIDAIRRISEAGADATVNYPFVYTCGPDASLDQKLDMMKMFGDNVIANMKDL